MYSFYGIFSFTHVSYRSHLHSTTAVGFSRLLLMMLLPWLPCATNVVPCNCYDTFKAANLLRNTTFPLTNSIYSYKREKHKLSTATLTATVRECRTMHGGPTIYTFVLVFIGISVRAHLHSRTFSYERSTTRITSQKSFHTSRCYRRNKSTPYTTCI